MIRKLRHQIPLLIVLATIVTTCLAQSNGTQPKPTTAEPKSTPRLADGHPDLSGAWGNRGGGFSFAKKVQDGDRTVIRFNDDRGPERPGVQKRVLSDYRPPYKPELLAKMRQLEQNQNKMDPAFFCKPAGVPRMGAPNVIVQHAGMPIVLLYETLTGNSFRLIPTDGRPHTPDPDPSYLGDSVGRWEGDTLVVDSTAFTDDTWLGIDGWFHSKNMRVTEKFTRTGDSLEYKVTVDDPDSFTHPWEMRPRTLSKLDTYDIMETPPCIEKDSQHLVNNDHH